MTKTLQWSVSRGSCCAYRAERWEAGSMPRGEGRGLRRGEWESIIYGLLGWLAIWNCKSFPLPTHPPHARTHASTHSLARTHTSNPIIHPSTAPVLSSKHGTVERERETGRERDRGEGVEISSNRRVVFKYTKSKHYCIFWNVNGPKEERKRRGRLGLKRNNV